MSPIIDLPPSNPALILINPEAGSRKKLPGMLAQMRSLAASRRWPVQFQVTQNADDLERRAQRAIGDGRRVLLAMGGDGTFQTLVNAAVGAADVILGVIPTGGGNDFAASLGSPRDPLRALGKIVHGKIQRVDLALAKTADGRERYYAGGGGVGLDSAAAHHAANEYRRVPGRLRYVMAALHALKGFESLDLNVEFPGSNQGTIAAKVLMASVLNTATYGGGVRLAPDARIDDGLLHVVVLENLKMLEIATIVPRLLASGELRTPRIARMKTTRVRLTTGRPCLFHGDGELLGPAPVEVTLIPGAIRVLTPARI